MGALFLIVAALFSSGYHQFDEHFQVFEFGGLKLGLTEQSNLPWEYHNQMRSAIQPAIVVLSHKIFGLVGNTNPFTLATFLRMLSALLSFISIHLLYLAYKSKFEDETSHRWFLLLSFFTWFAVYNNIRFSSENLSGTIFLIGFALYQIKQAPNRWHFLLLGSLLGLSFLFRYQAGFLIAGMFLWMLLQKKEKITNLVLLSAGVVALIGVGVLIDRWFYGEWTITTWNYLEQFWLGEASRFGASPWWEYIRISLVKAIPPFSLVFVGSVFTVLVFRRKDILTWTVVPFLLVHFVIGHKELRFLFPIVPLLPIFIIKALSIIEDKWHYGITERTWFRGFVKVFWGVNIVLLLIVTFRPADYQIPLYEAVYDNYEQPITMYYKNDNPYHRILDIHFYKRPDLHIRKIDSMDEIDLGVTGKCLLVTRDIRDLERTSHNSMLVYSTFPEWVRQFNFNNWIERTKLWYVYELSE